MFSNSYYDHTDLGSPIKRYISTSSSFLLNIESATTLTMPITPTLVRYLNGSSEYTYMTASPELKENHIGSPIFALLIGAIGITPEMYIIEQQLNYQPILNSTTRMLEGPSTFGRNLDTTTQTVEEDKNDGFLYTAFFIMAQLGGFYSFLKLILSPFVNKIYQSMLMVDLINKFKENETKSKLNKSTNQIAQR